MTPDQMIEEVHKCAQQPHPGVEIEGAVSTRSAARCRARCPRNVVRIAKALAEFCDGVALADTVGYTASSVKRLFKQGKGGDRRQAGRAHFHNTRGLGLANALAAYEKACALRQLDGRPWRLPVRAGRERQRDHRGSGVHVREHGRADHLAGEAVPGAEILVKGVPGTDLRPHAARGLPKGFRAAA